MSCWTNQFGYKYYFIDDPINKLNVNITYSWIQIDNLYYLLRYRHDKIKYLIHREDGPALEFSNVNWWVYHGQQIHCKDNEEFLKIIKMKAFL